MNRRADRARSRPRMLPAVLAAGVVLAGVAAAQSSTALWTASAPSHGITVTAGTAGIEFVAPQPVDGATISPGASVELQGGSLRATGDVELELSVTRDATGTFSDGDVFLQLGFAEPGEECVPTEMGLWPGARVGIGRLTASGGGAPGVSMQVCALFLMAETATEGSGAAVRTAITITGVQR